MCLSRPLSTMILCHSAMERPYFVSIDGKYEAGPCFGQGADCSAMVDISPSRARGRANCRCILAPPGDPDRQRREALRLSENGPWPPRRWTVGKNGDTDELAPFAPFAPSNSRGYQKPCGPLRAACPRLGHDCHPPCTGGDPGPQDGRA